MVGQARGKEENSPSRTLGSSEGIEGGFSTAAPQPSPPKPLSPFQKRKKAGEERDAAQKVHSPRAVKRLGDIKHIEYKTTGDWARDRNVNTDAQRRLEVKIRVRTSSIRDFLVIASFSHAQSLALLTL